MFQLQSRAFLSHWITLVFAQYLQVEAKLSVIYIAKLQRDKIYLQDYRIFSNIAVLPMAILIKVGTYIKHWKKENIFAHHS